ncbi:MAG: tetratricopeptide repeat protein [Deltaproteobacteria bacterium]|nr:tetratricopeptide repeat protein [Deltaproteobacteria bacterium]
MKASQKWIAAIIIAVVAAAGGTYWVTVKTVKGKSLSRVSETEVKKSPFAKGAEEPFKKGHEFLREKKFDAALKAFEESAKLSPDTPIAHYWMGMTYFYKKETEKAIAKFKKVLDIEPKNYHARAMIGKILSFDKAKLDEAIVELQKSLEMSPDYTEAHFDLGRIYALKGDMNRAMAEFGIIFRAEPQYAFYHFELGRIFEGMKATDRAKKEYSRALQLNPDFTQAKQALQKIK